MEFQNFGPVIVFTVFNLFWADSSQNVCVMLRYSELITIPCVVCVVGIVGSEHFINMVW